MIKFKRVIVGISGGVDSAVAALLLKKRGYDVHGVFMQNWDIRDERGVCMADQDYKDAEFVCDKIKIPLTHVNFVKEYWNEVFTNLVKDYESGYTPNPDVLCNRNVKFNHFYKQAMERFGGDAMATGHYANTNFGPYLEQYDPSKRVRLLRPEDHIKDQTFFLCQVREEALRKTMFPLAHLQKGDVKSIAKENGLEKIAAKKESMGICFIGTRNFQEFISEYVENKSGNFIDIDTGAVVGQHSGLHHWTLGQRSRVHGLPEAYFIAKKDVSTNTIYVAMGTKHHALHGRNLATEKPFWIGGKPTELENGNILTCQFTFQHTQDLVGCKVMETDRGLVVQLDEDKRALTEGQYAVFYQEKICLGSARIRELQDTKNILTLPSSFTLACLEYAFSNKETIQRNADTYNYHTRFGKEMLVPYHRTAKSQNNFNYTAVKLYNALPNDLKKIESARIFKAEVKKLVMEGVFYSLEEYYMHLRTS